MFRQLVKKSVPKNTQNRVITKQVSENFNLTLGGRIAILENKIKMMEKDQRIQKSMETHILIAKAKFPQQ